MRLLNTKKLKHDNLLLKLLSFAEIKAKSVLGGTHSTEVAFAVLTQQPWVRFIHF